MSFAYIDSQGKEVQIPSADALRLRIELGAIKDATEFYDAAQDRWAPARDHEIYRTLKREVEESSVTGFVAPPPSTLEPPPPPPPAEEPVPPAPDPTPSAPDPTSPTPDQEAVADPRTGPAEESSADPREGPAEEFAIEEDVFGEFTLDDLPEPGYDLGVDDDFGSADDDDFDFGGEGLTLADTTEAETPGVAGGTTGEAGVAGGGMSDADEPDTEVDDLDLEVSDFGVAGDADLEAPEAEATPRWDVSSDLADTADPTPLEKEPDFGMAFEGGAADDEYDDDDGTDTTVEPLDVESSDMSSYDPDAGSSWIEEEAGADETFSRAGPGPLEEERRDPYERDIRRTSAPPPRREVTPAGNGLGRLVAIVAVLAAVVAGGFFVARNGGEDSAEAVEQIVLPELSAELQPQLRALAQRASRRTVAAFDSLPARVALPESPSIDWLSGEYLAQVSRYDAIEQYWNDLDALLQRMIAEEDALWTGAFEEEVEAANMSADNAGAVLERGLAGWEAAGADRDIVYEQLRRVIETSLDLHAFLRSNEAEIQYTPAAAGRDRDPVLEAVPSSEELGEEMWARVGAITNALDALGYLQQVETEPLLEVVKEKLVATGIR